MHPVLNLLMPAPKTFALPATIIRTDAEASAVTALQQSIKQAGWIHFGLADPGAYALLESYFIARPDRYAGGLSRVLVLIAENKHVIADAALAQIFDMPAPSKKVAGMVMNSFVTIKAPDATSPMVKAVVNLHKNTAFSNIGELFSAIDIGVIQATEAAQSATDKQTTKRKVTA